MNVKYAASELCGYAKSIQYIIDKQEESIKSVCHCKEGKQGRTVDANYNQICDVCGGS